VERSEISPIWAIFAEFKALLSLDSAEDQGDIRALPQGVKVAFSLQ
jgi:hypothetical protein